jgi:hypothetical protein
MLGGIVPWTHVDSMWNDCRLLSCPMVVGRVPLRLTLDIYRLDKLDIEPMVVGMEPSKTCRSRHIHITQNVYTDCNVFVYYDRSLSILICLLCRILQERVPVNELHDNVSLTSFVRHPMLGGIVPWTHVDSTRNDCRLLSCPIVVGRAPLRLTLYTTRLDKLDIEPIVVGMEPRICMHASDVI